MSVSSERSPLLRPDNKIQIDNYYAFASPAHIEGSPDELKSSPVRRTFCLIVLFDFAINFIAWVLFMQLHFKSLSEGFHSEVIDYHINCSIFDIIILAVVRFIYLEILYGCVKSKYPWFLAISTLITSVFVIAKICLYNVDCVKMLPTNRNLNIFGYICIIIAFILAWVETLFLIYRVLPQEKAAQKVLDYYQYISEQYGSEQQLNSTNMDRNSQNFMHNSLTVSDEENDEFFSPGQTRPGSPTLASYKEILHKAKLIKEQALEICNNTKDWKYISGDAIEGFITSKEISSYTGKVFKIECFLHVSPEVLYNDFVNNAESTPQWNPQVRIVKKLQSISENVDIIYNLSNSALKGYIAPRDFVLLRTWGTSSNRFFIYMKSHEYEECPPSPNVIRGDYGIGAMVFEKYMNDPNQTKMIWILNNDIKGNMFRSMVDRAMPKILSEMIGNLRLYCQVLNTSIS